MQLLLIQRILGLFLIVFSSTQIPPMLVSIIYADGALVPFFDAFSITLITGIVMWLPVKNVKRELRMRDGFLVVVMFWTVLGLFGSIPFIMSELVPISITDAVFESISGLTTTGATVMQGIDSLPESEREDRIRQVLNKLARTVGVTKLGYKELGYQGWIQQLPIRLGWSGDDLDEKAFREEIRERTKIILVTEPINGVNYQAERALDGEITIGPKK